jgi:hypothetical protein
MEAQLGPQVFSVLLENVKRGDMMNILRKIRNGIPPFPKEASEDILQVRYTKPLFLSTGSAPVPLRSDSYFPLHGCAGVGNFKQLKFMAHDAKLSPLIHRYVNVFQL